nr:nonribosomal peptide synthetase 2-like [Quercus suber]
MAIQLSILNPNPELLTGPNLLHDLIPLTSPTDADAVHHTFADRSQEVLSYEKLHAKAAALACRLISARAESIKSSGGGRFIVPLFIPQSPVLYITQLAVLKAGGAFCPIPLDAPEERLRFILQDVGASLLLTIKSLKNQLPAVDGVEILDVEEDVSKPKQQWLPVNINASQPAYIMYTSGSTGQPKGVVLSHAAATQAMLAHDLHIPHFSRFLQFANPTFDVSIFEIFFPLFRGCTVVSCDRQQLLNDLPGVINRLHIDAAELTPSVVSTLLGRRSNVPGLKLLLTIGEMLKKSVIEEFGGDGNEPAILHGMYGPTEATIHCTFQTACAKDMPTGNIGTPLNTVSAYVVKPAVMGTLNEPVQVLPVGEEGELAVGGFQLADGYLNRDEQTQKSFIQDPKHGRLYRTGDRARLGLDGRLQCLGRMSSGQIKLRGQRIELGEVEYAAVQTSGCTSAVADVLDGTLVVFCVCENESTTAGDIRARCRQWLPAYMVPGEILIMESLPYLSSGKVDRQVLARHYTQINQKPDHSRGELTREEQHIADIMGTVLKQPLGLHTKFSAIGVDSLSAIRIAAKLRSNGLPRLDAITILEAVDVPHLRRLISTQAHRETQERENFVAKDPRLALSVEQILSTQISTVSSYDRIYACTSVQAAMLSETARDPQAYCNWILLETIEYSFDRINAALNQLAQTHALLRSGFVALEETTASYAIVQRMHLLQEQICQVESFRRDFVLKSVDDLLVPCRFHVRLEPGQTQILVQIHHALYDQWSIDVVKADLHDCLEVREIHVAASFQTISDYQSTQHQEPQLEASLDFWRDELHGFSPSPIPNLNSREVSSALDRTTWLKTDFDTSKLRESSRAHGFSVPSIFQAALACLLSSYAGTTDIIFGSVFSGRHIPVAGVERIFGPCLNTLPCRVDISNTRTCLDLLRLVNDRNRSMQRHSLTPLTEIKNLSGCAPGSRLFDTLFVWQETSLELQSTDGVREVDSADHHEFNLVIEYEPSSTELRVRATYQQSLLPNSQVLRLLNQLNNMAKLLVENVDDELGRIYTGIDQNLLSLANPHPQPCGPREGLVSKIEKQSRHLPSSIAITFLSSIDTGNRTAHDLTYAQLHKQSNKLANHLITLGVTPNTVVCIWMEKCLELYVAILAILKCGAAYLPLVSETPKQRVESVVAQADVTFCLCDSTTIQNSSKLHTPQFININNVDISRSSADTPNVPYVGSNLAYVVFTSGSTGTPKGVGVTFENINGNLAVLAELYQVKAGDRLLQACSHAFDVSVFEILFAMSTGMTLCSGTKSVLFQDLEQTIRDLQITHLSLTPTVAALVDPTQVPSVRFLVTAGEAVTDMVHQRWAGHGLHTGYGPSETTNICNVHMHTYQYDTINNVGPPLRNTSAFVISPEKKFEIMPAGALGELAFGGEQVFRGYLGMHDLNATKIINHAKYGRIYRSGDLGRLLVDGTMMVTGRLDDQIKIRGNRVELGEINSTLLRQPFVSECVTIVRGSGSAEQMLVAFWLSDRSAPDSSSHVKLAQGHGDRVTEMYDHLEASLPSYMIPGLLIPVTKMPLTTQGKLDKRSLLAFLDTIDADTCSALSRSDGGLESDNRWTDEERLVAKALSQTLHIAEASIGRTSSFLSVGLNSLSAIAFAKSLGSRLERRIGIDVILRNQTVVRLTRAIASTSSAEPDSSASIVSTAIPDDLLSRVKEKCKARKLLVDEVLPCTPLQAAMLAASTTGKGMAYCNTTSFNIAGDIDKLKQCWNQVAARQAILRTVFIETESLAYPYMQVVLKEKTIPWQTVDADAENPKVRKLFKHVDMANVVDTFQPCRMVISRSSSSCCLTLFMHHAIYDGISIANLLEEVEYLYRRQALPTAISFKPFLAQSAIENTSEALQYWSEQLHGFTPQPFPKSVEAEQSSVEQLCKGTLDVSTSEMEEFCKKHSVTQLSLFQTAWAKVLSVAQESKDICFGNVVSGRTTSTVDLDRLVAPCFNTIPVRVRFDEFCNNGTILRYMQNQNISNMKFQLTGLRNIQPLSTRPDLHLFDSMLLLQPPQRQLDADIWTLTKDDGAMDLPLVVEIVPTGAQIEVLLHYMDSIISQDLAKDLIHAYASALSSCLRFFAGDINHFVNFENSKFSGRLSSSVFADTDKAEEGDDDGSPWTSEEALVREVLANLARVSESSITKSTSIYRLGLDSLNAAQVATQLRSKGVQIDLADVIEKRTVKAIAGATGRKSIPGSENQGLGIDFAAFEQKYRPVCMQTSNLQDDWIEAIRPCTSVQNGMLVQSLHARGALYINHVTYDIPKGVSPSDVKRAWQLVQYHHAVLRMGFCHVECDQGPFAMIIFRPQSVDLLDSNMFHDLSQRTIGEDIINRVHLPAWRFGILSDPQNHKMQLSIHHALYDADSLQLLLRDFQRAIQQEDLGPAISIDPLLIATLDAATQNLDEAHGFWKQTMGHAHFAKFPNLVPTVVGNGSIQSLDRRCRFDTSTIEESCKRLNCTIQALGQAAWAVLLDAYTGETQSTFGTVLSGQLVPKAHEVAFPNITTIPVHCDTSKSSSEIVTDMVSYNASAQRYRYLPLSEIQRLAERPAQALFDTVFVYQKTAVAPEDRFDWSLLSETASVDYTASLELETLESDQVLTRLTFNTAQIPYDQGKLILCQYEAIIADLMDESRLVDDEQVFSVLAAKEPTLPSSINLLHEFVELGAKEYPHRCALRFVLGMEESADSSRSWTYQQLNERGNQVAHLILQQNTRPGNIIAVCMDKCAEASFAFLGILKAGCAFLAIDPDLPVARRRFILEDSGAALLFTGPDDIADDCLADLVVLPLSEAVLTNLPNHKPMIGRQTPDTTSYCLYTSGTTGTPKGCELTHENAVQAMLSFQRLFAGRWSSASRWLQFASYWFDVSVLEQYWSWSVGITVVGARRDLVLEDLPAFIESQKITHIDLTPSLARLLKPEDVPSLHGGVFITGGEALRQEIIDAWGMKHTICNGYGPTEATIGVTMNTFVGPEAKPSNIGSQFDNVGSYVLAPGTDRPVLRGAIGELCVSGKLVGKGYLNRPELTETSFPFLKRLGCKVYRTGDLVRLLHDGSFMFEGRKDSQSKLRGQRLETAEIDVVVKASSDSIIDTLATVIKASNGAHEMLVSFLATDHAKKGRELIVDFSDQARQLTVRARQACEQHLPAYMVPTHFIPITMLPLTVNNKIDGKRLTAFFDSLTTQNLQDLRNTQADNGPLNEIEHKIVESLAGMVKLSCDQLGRSSNVFSVGLSSVSAITFAGLLKRQGLSTANVALIMKYPTVSTLARALSTEDEASQAFASSVKQAQLSINAFAQRYQEVATRTLSITSDRVESVVPCTPLQEGLILDSIRHTEKPYFNEFRYMLPQIQATRLQVALQKLVDSAQLLRTKFIQVEDGYAQVVLRQHHITLMQPPRSVEDIESFLAAQKLMWLEDNREELLRPVEFDLVRSQTGHMLVIYIHHALYDGISWQLLLQSLYDSYENGELSVIGPPFVNVLPYGPLRDQIGAESFWQQRLSNMQLTRMPKESSTQSGKGFAITMEIHEVANLEKVRTSLGVSHQSVLQSCFEVAFQQHFPNITAYGVIISGRSIGLEGADKIMGPVFNTVPQSMRANQTDSWAQLIRRAHDSNVALLPFQHTPLRSIRKWCKRPPDDSMFDTLFVFQHDTNINTAASKWKPIDQPPRAEYPLAFEVSLIEDEVLQVTVVAQGGVTNEDRLHALLQDFRATIQLSAQDSDQEISRNYQIQENKMQEDPEAVSQETSPLNGVPEFVWDAEAGRLRDTIAELASLQCSNVNEYSTIFSLGLDSIDAVKLSSRLRKAGMAISVSQLLKAQTIAGMLKVIKFEKMIDNGVDKPQESRLVTLEDQLRHSISAELKAGLSVDRVLPATPSQEALIADMLRSELREYFNHDVLHLRTDIEFSRLGLAIQKVVNCSPILRTSFMEVTNPDIDAVYAQLVHKANIPLNIEEISLSDTKGIDGLLEDIRQSVQASGSRQPPLRFTFVSVGSERYLVLSIAHAQYDGHSLTLMHEDICAAYNNNLKQRPAPDSLIGFAIDATSEEACRFWKDTVGGATTSSFPRADNQENLSAMSRAEKICAISTVEAREFCRQQECSLQALAQVCWSIVLAHYTRSLEVMFGAVLACRDSEEAEQIMFPAMNTIPIRTALHGSRRDILRYMQSTVNDVRPYQRTPLRTVQALCKSSIHRDGSVGTSHLFDTIFIYQHRPEEASDHTDLLYKSVRGTSSIEYPVAVEMESIKDKLTIRAACKASALDSAGTKDLLDALDRVVTAVVHSPHEPTVEFINDKVSICGLPSFKLLDHVASSFDLSHSYGTSSLSKKDDSTLSPTALTIREAFAKVSKLPADSISPSASIESIGIDSISAIKVAALLRSESVTVSVGQLLRAKTVNGVEELLTSSIDQEGQNRPIPAHEAVAVTVSEECKSAALKDLGLGNNDIDVVLPATAGQIYMLCSWFKTNGQLFYPTFTYRLKTDLPLERLHQTWLSLAKSHVMLRTIFCTVKDSSSPFLQLVLKEIPESSFQVGRAVLIPRHQPMANLFVTREDYGFLLEIKIHHALYDAITQAFIMQDFLSLLHNTEPPQCQPSYEDFLALSVTPQAVQSRRRFWTSYLSNVDQLRFEQPGRIGRLERVELYTPGLFTRYDALVDRARKQNITVQALFFAICAKIYGCLARNGDINGDVVLGVYLSNRSHLHDLENLRAPTLNLVPLLFKSPAAKTVLELAQTVQTDLRNIGTAENSAVGLWEITNWTSLTVDAFINYIKLPDRDTNKAWHVNEAVIETTGSNDNNRPFSRVSSPPTQNTDTTPLGGLTDVQISDAYQYSIDIEATVVDGALDMGLFCFEEMLNLDTAKMVLKQTKEMLEELAG